MPAWFISVVLALASTAAGEDFATALSEAQRVHTSGTWQESDASLDQLTPYMGDATPEERIAIQLMRARNRIIEGDMEAGLSVLDQIVGSPEAASHQKLRALELSISASLIAEEFEDAYRRLGLAIELAPQVDHPGIVSSIFSLAGRLESMAGNFDRAHAYAQHGADLAEQQGSDRDICYAFYRLGLTQELLNQTDAAYDTFQSALQPCEATDEPLVISAVRTQLGSLLASKGDLDESRRQLEAGLTLARESRFVSNERSAAMGMGILHLANGDHEKATQILTDWLVDVEENAPAQLQAEFHELLARAARIRGDDKAAAEHLASQLSARERFLDHERTMRLAFSAAELDSVRREQDLQLMQARAENSELAQERQRQQQIMLVGALGALILIGLLLGRLLQTSYRERRRLADIAELDPLTGLLNHSAFFDHAARAMNGQGDGGDHCLVAADVDHFKKINDRHGHLVGDQVLQTLASRLGWAFDRHGLVGRVGGEEFTIALPNCGIEKAKSLIERCRRQPIAVEAGGMTVAVTLSFGIACGQHSESLAQLRQRADAALYWAKNEGRDQVQVASELAAEDMQRAMAS